MISAERTKLCFTVWHAGYVCDVSEVFFQEGSVRGYRLHLYESDGDSAYPVNTDFRKNRPSESQVKRFIQNNKRNS